MGDPINGTYSEVGIIFGTVDGNTATGNGCKERLWIISIWYSQTGEYFTWHIHLRAFNWPENVLIFQNLPMLNARN